VTWLALTLRVEVFVHITVVEAEGSARANCAGFGAVGGHGEIPGRLYDDMVDEVEDVAM
jgi:hypothetical protein